MKRSRVRNLILDPVRESLVSSGMLHGIVSFDRRGRDYISGVDHALMWACGQAVTPL